MHFIVHSIEAIRFKPESPLPSNIRSLVVTVDFNHLMLSIYELNIYLFDSIIIIILLYDFLVSEHNSEKRERKERKGKYV